MLPSKSIIRPWGIKNLSAPQLEAQHQCPAGLQQGYGNLPCTMHAQVAGYITAAVACLQQEDQILLLHMHQQQGHASLLCMMHEQPVGLS